MYVKFEDSTNRPTSNLETVIGIRAPTDRHCPLEVSNPDQGMKPGERRYAMYLNRKGAVATTEPQHPSMRGSPTAHEVKRGGGEPINVYLVQPRAKKQQPQQAQGGKQEGPEITQTSTQPPSPQHSNSKAARAGVVGAEKRGRRGH